MKRRHRAKSDILIDLTSLLDVIFIVLLVVFARTQNLTEKTDDQVNSANETLAQANILSQQAQAEYELYQDQIEMADNLQQYVFTISVNSSYRSDDVTRRQISVLPNGGEIITFELRGADVKKEMEKFRETMKQYVEAHPDQPVILTLNEKDEKILYRDEEAIKKIFKELCETHDNVFMR